MEKSRNLEISVKDIAIQRIKNGEAKVSVARDMGIACATIYGWCRRNKSLNKMKPPPTSADIKTKLIAIQRIKNGETKASVAQDINVPIETLIEWYGNSERLEFVAERFVEEHKEPHSVSSNHRSSSPPAAISTIPQVSALSDENQPILLWQLHDLNQTIIERMADKSPKTAGLDFNGNEYTPQNSRSHVGLCMQPCMGQHICRNGSWLH